MRDLIGFIMLFGFLICISLFIYLQRKESNDAKAFLSLAALLALLDSLDHIVGMIIFWSRGFGGAGMVRLYSLIVCLILFYEFSRAITIDSKAEELRP